jgi:hypothetical protein
MLLNQNLICSKINSKEFYIFQSLGPANNFAAIHIPDHPFLEDPLFIYLKKKNQ